jgi:hypothetical protein
MPMVREGIYIMSVTFGVAIHAVVAAVGLFCVVFSVFVAVAVGSLNKRATRYGSQGRFQILLLIALTVTCLAATYAAANRIGWLLILLCHSICLTGDCLAWPQRGHRGRT